MEFQKYERIDQASLDNPREDLPDYDDACGNAEQKLALRRAFRIVYLLTVVLVLSVASNVLLLSRLYYVQEHQHDPSYVGLERNVVMDIPHDDRTIDDPMWDAPELDWNVGWVALDNKEVAAKGIPTAMHWPWDDSKSIYVFHAFHSLHCVFVLRDALMSYRDGKHQLWPFGHVTHCLHVLREDTTCNADDTPRYTGRLHSQENSTTLFSGIGQNRQCRDWNQLREYAIENSACYRRPLDRYEPLLDRYKHCPDGKMPWLEGQES